MESFVNVDQFLEIDPSTLGRTVFHEQSFHRYQPNDRHTELFAHVKNECKDIIDAGKFEI
jgi:hypothetical protein